MCLRTPLSKMLQLTLSDLAGLNKGFVAKRVSDGIPQSPTFTHTLITDFSSASDSASRDCLPGIYDLVNAFYEYCTLDKSVKYLN